jgi:hypothetical protein
MVCGLDLHRRQITFDALEVDSGKEWRGRIWQPDRERFRRWLRNDLARRAGVARWRWRWRAAPAGATWSRRSRPPGSRRTWPSLPIRRRPGVASIGPRPTAATPGCCGSCSGPASCRRAGSHPKFIPLVGDQRLHGYLEDPPGRDGLGPRPLDQPELERHQHLPLDVHHVARGRRARDEVGGQRPLPALPARFPTVSRGHDLITGARARSRPPRHRAPACSARPTPAPAALSPHDARSTGPSGTLRPRRPRAPRADRSAVGGRRGGAQALLLILPWAATAMKWRERHRHGRDHRHRRSLVDALLPRRRQPLLAACDQHDGGALAGERPGAGAPDAARCPQHHDDAPTRWGRPGRGDTGATVGCRRPLHDQSSSSSAAKGLSPGSS